MLANQVFWWSMLFYTRMLLLLQPPMLWCKATTKVNFARIQYRKSDPGWEGNLVWQTGLPALAGHPTYHVNVIKLKWEIIWTGGLPLLSGLPHLPGVPHLHVNRPKVENIFIITKHSGMNSLPFVSFVGRRYSRGCWPLHLISAT